MARPPGAPNRDSFYVRDKLRSRGVDAIDEILNLIGELDDPARKVWAWLEVAKFCYPKPTAALPMVEDTGIKDRADELLKELEVLQQEKRAIEVIGTPVHNKP